jgi:hypothetical protein
MLPKLPLEAILILLKSDEPYLGVEAIKKSLSSRGSLAFDKPFLFHDLFLHS